jgi:hypothetical protein
MLFYKVIIFDEANSKAVPAANAITQGISAVSCNSQRSIRQK